MEGGERLTRSHAAQVLIGNSLCFQLSVVGNDIQELVLLDCGFFEDKRLCLIHLLLPVLL